MGFHPHLPRVRLAHFPVVVPDAAHSGNLPEKQPYLYSFSMAPEGQKNSVVQRLQSVHFSSSILLMS
jgi:hypothetical protein